MMRPPSVDGVINPKQSNLLRTPGLLRRGFSLGDWFSSKLFSQRPHPLHAEDSATTKEGEHKDSHDGQQKPDSCKHAESPHDHTSLPLSL